MHTPAAVAVMDVMVMAMVEADVVVVVADMVPVVMQA
jgi:hypothetical protein